MVRSRLENWEAQLSWIVGDITRWRSTRTYDIWHDRAVLHFLNDETDQRAYASALDAALAPGGVAIIGTFALDGPERCSGLPVTRHDAATIGRILGPRFVLIETIRHDHVTPWQALQRFQFSVFGETPAGHG